MSIPQAIFEMPATWTGMLQIRGCTSDENGVKESVDCEAEFFGVYAQTVEGLHMWVEDCYTRDQANDLAKYLKSTI
uniref:Putative DNA primase, TraC n=1 Tax=Pseudomonas migulae TaxID=78543 RepID=R4IUQ4_9PSED|nr:hypothetical protein [Pseudomonas migulae]AGC70411.1 putative DNA primase, TraC [Pseudomonas migulae]